jgi:hypothetical protein
MKIIIELFLVAVVCRSMIMAAQQRHLLLIIFLFLFITRGGHTAHCRAPRSPPKNERTALNSGNIFFQPTNDDAHCNGVRAGVDFYPPEKTPLMMMLPR